MKKMLTMCAVALAAACVTADQWKDPETGITWTYSVSGGKASVNGADPAKGAIAIPSTLGGFLVTSIGEGAFCARYGLTLVTIPEDVTSIGNEAFLLCTGLTSVTIPGGVTSIGNEAFCGCSSLTSATIPSSVTSIGGGAFSECSGLTSVTLQDGLTIIGEEMFYDCTGLASVTIPEGVTRIGDRAFSYCSGLISITIPESVTSIGYGAFAGCSGLPSVTIPSSVTSIGDNAFGSCSGLAAINVEVANAHYSSQEGVLFDKIATMLVQYPGGKQGAYAIPSSVTSIGECAFSYCGGLTSVTIPSSVTSIVGYAFFECSNLASVTIPEGVTSIGDGAFFECSNLTSVTIPSSVTSIGESVFGFCSGLAAINVEAANVHYSSQEGVLFNKNATMLVQYPGGKQGAYAMPSCVTNIGNYAFSGCSGLTSVTIPEGVTSIGDATFFGCSGLTRLTIPSSVTSIGERAFCDCVGLTRLTIPASVTSIGERAFYGCSGLTSVTIGKGVTSIGEWAFYGCSGLDAIDFEGAPPEGVMDAKIKQDAAIRYNVAYETQWLPVVKQCGWTNAKPYTPGVPQMTFTTGGDADWFFDSSVSYDGNGSARSGSIGHEESTWLMLDVSVDTEMILSFRWKVSSEGTCDPLCWYLDGVERAKIGGKNVGWGLQTAKLSPGNHKIKWEYSKDDEETEGEDCGWMDTLTISIPDTSPAKTYFVNGKTGSDSYDGLSPSSAKATIQAAIDMTKDGDTILVSAGTYAPISAWNKAILIRGVEGAEKTFIDGGNTNACAKLCVDGDSGVGTDGRRATLEGFTLQNGSSNRLSDGWCSAVYRGTVKKCIIRSCYAYEYYGWASICNGCAVSDTLAHGNACSSYYEMYGGVFKDADVVNCTVVGNQCYGLYNSKAWNTISWNNTYEGRVCDVGFTSGAKGFLNYCLTQERISAGEGNIAGIPQFVNVTNNDYRLKAWSLGVDVGSNAHVTNTTDLAGCARVADGIVDMGCYEYGSQPMILDGLVARYEFDGSLADSSGHEYTLHSNKAESYTTDRFGKGNSAYWLDGGACLYKAVAGETSIECRTNYTFACWFKASENTALRDVASSGIWGISSDIKYIVGHTSYPIAVGTNGINVFEWGDCYLPARFRYDGNLGTAWHHLALSAANDQDITVYLDGCQIGAFVRSSRVWNVTLGLGCYDGGSAQRYIGMGAFCYGGQFKGGVDDARFYNRALSGDEVRALCQNASQPILYVNGTSGSDGNDGRSKLFAKKTIQAAIDVANDGDTILVSDGTYDPITIEGFRGIIIRGINGAAKTIIDGKDSASLANLNSDDASCEKGDVPNQIIGFTLQHGRATTSGSCGALRGGLAVNCVLRSNYGSGYGSGSVAYGGNLINCII